ncbi:MAG: SGNH/GDSL hydrolase family protein [Nonlabens sp.]
MKKAVKNYLICFVCFLGASSCHLQKVEELDYYDFKNEEEIKTFGSFQIDKITETKIFFSTKEGDLTDKKLYDGKVDELNFNGTYKLIEKTTKESYYFKFGWQKYNNTELSHVNWLKDIPRKAGEFDLKVVSVPFVQFGELKLCTIGDSQTWWGNAKYLRQFMNMKNENFWFVGSNQDVFGFCHEGEGGNHTKDVVKRIDDMPYADIYTILLGTNDYKGNVEESAQNLIYIVEQLKQKNKEAKIYYVTPLPTTNKERDTFNKELKDKFLATVDKSIDVIYLGEHIRSLKNWERLFPDGLHANKEGYRLIANYLTSKIKVGH